MNLVWGIPIFSVSISLVFLTFVVDDSGRKKELLSKTYNAMVRLKKSS